MPEADRPTDHEDQRVASRTAQCVVIHRAPQALQVRLAGDVGADRAHAAARRIAASRDVSHRELDLSRVTHLEAEAVHRLAAVLAAAAPRIAGVVVRARPGPVMRLLEAAGLAEEDGGPATVAAARSAVRLPDGATEVVMRFYEALADRDWPDLRALVAAPDTIADFHAEAVRAVPGVRSSVAATESDGRVVLVRGRHAVPARQAAPASFRHRWSVVDEHLATFEEQVDPVAYGHLRALRGT